jgi:2-polyprenyl-3-methyl-5-hydroxy-6-metoxy-1,4-benzoquinol methylase
MTASEGTNPFIVSEGGTQTAWLFNQGDIVTRAMGGVFAERAGDLAGIRHILDLGCGSGTWAMDVAQHYPDVEVTGVDINASLIPYVRAHSEVR